MQGKIQNVKENWKKFVHVITAEKNTDAKYYREIIILMQIISDIVYSEHKFLSH